MGYWATNEYYKRVDGRILTTRRAGKPQNPDIKLIVRRSPTPNATLTPFQLRVLLVFINELAPAIISELDFHI